MTLPTLLHTKLSAHFGSVADLRLQAVGGGSINETYRLSFSGRSLFLKLNSATKFPHLFQTEKEGLALLARQKVIQTPTVIDCFEVDEKQFLLLEWIQSGERNDTFWKKFGEQLAALHRVTSECFGLEGDNYMGSVPQGNQRHHTWVDFFVAERLTPMLQRCAEKTLLSKKQLAQFEHLQTKLDTIFEPEKPSLLHGDLWSGNFMCNEASLPVLIDPAVYFGHRSVDLAMTTLFGGFRQPFYEAYHYHFSLPSNYEEQFAICNLYPLLIHLYLFGTSYLASIERTLQRFA